MWAPPADTVSAIRTAQASEARLFILKRKVFEKNIQNNLSIITVSPL